MKTEWGQKIDVQKVKQSTNQCAGLFESRSPAQGLKVNQSIKFYLLKNVFHCLGFV